MKLVRDRIGDIPWPDEDNKRHLGWVEPHSSGSATRQEYRELLRDKLREEIAELLAVDGTGQPGAVFDEAADVFEVLRALLVANGVDSPARVVVALQRTAAVKRVARGGFFQGRTYDGPIRENHPAGPPSAPVVGEQAPEAVPDASEAPGAAQRVAETG